MAKSIEFANYSERLRDGGVINCGKHIYQTEGIHGFWKGFSACSARAVVANSFMFMAYEYAQKHFRKEF